MQHERFHYRTLDELKEKAKELNNNQDKVKNKDRGREL